jgi:hypothetical protein
MYSYSTDLRNKIAAQFPWQEAMANGVLKVYSGAKPATADASVGSATLLVTFSLAGAAYVAPTQMIAKITLAGGSGSVDGIALGGSTASDGILLMSSSVSFITDLTATAAAVATNINATHNALGVYATSSGADIRIMVPRQLGAKFNKLHLYAASTTLTVQLNGGTAGLTADGLLDSGSPYQLGVYGSNGLNFTFPPAAGVITKEATVWSGTAVASGTASWFRFTAGGHDGDAASSEDSRFDGSIGTSGADLNLNSTLISAASAQTISTWSITVPATN